MQRDRGDWVDGIAATARTDRAFPRSGNVEAVRARLREMGADDDAFAALDDGDRLAELLTAGRVTDRREADPRRALDATAERWGVDLTALSRMIGRHEGYLGRFVREGKPRALKADEHHRLAAFFGVDDRALGVRQLWVPLG